MPIYEYRCLECGELFERFRYLSQSDGELVCPACGSPRIERQFSTFAASSQCMPTATGVT